MTNVAVIKKTVDQIKKEKVNSKFRLTPGRLNEVFDFLGIPYKAESVQEPGKLRHYDLINPKGERLTFASMSELIFETPIKQAIEVLSADKMDKKHDDFFSDIIKAEEPAKVKRTRTVKKTQNTVAPKRGRRTNQNK